MIEAVGKGAACPPRLILLEYKYINDYSSINQ